MRGDCFPASDNLPDGVTQADIDDAREGEPREDVGPEYDGDDGGRHLPCPLPLIDDAPADIFDHISRSKREA